MSDGWGKLIKGNRLAMIRRRIDNFKYIKKINFQPRMHTAKKLGIVKIVGVAESEMREGSSGNDAI